MPPRVDDAKSVLDKAPSDEALFDLVEQAFLAGQIDDQIATADEDREDDATDLAAALEVHREGQREQRGQRRIWLRARSG